MQKLTYPQAIKDIGSKKEKNILFFPFIFSRLLLIKIEKVKQGFT